MIAADGAVTATFVRGGTSKAIVFREDDLPQDHARWDAIFLRAMGSPDGYGRQLDGMGGGLSSLSKVAVVGPSTVVDADVDYLFVQVPVDGQRCDYSGNCGNIASAIGPFAVDQGFVTVPADDEAVVRIHNRNTGKRIVARFGMRDGRPIREGSLVIPGVSGSGAPVRLEFEEPGGASTGKLLPTGAVRTTLVPADGAAVEVSCVDAANACIFVPAAALGLSGTELPDELEQDDALMRRLAAIRVAGSLAMGIASSAKEAASIALIPLVVIISRPQAASTLDGEMIEEGAIGVTARVLSNGRIHRAIPMTASICLAAAAQIPGTVVNQVAMVGNAPLLIGMPSGVLTVDAQVDAAADDYRIATGTIFRTSRKLFEGRVFVGSIAAGDGAASSLAQPEVRQAGGFR